MTASRVEQYLDAVAQLHSRGAIALVSVILFGSAAGGLLSVSSDVDIILVLSDEATSQDRLRLRSAVADLEIAHGFRLPESPARNALEKFVEHAVGDSHSCFFCTRCELLSGDVGRVFGLRTAEKIFVERMVFASVIVSARTVWGEDLLGHVPLRSLRQLDVFKALFRLSGMVLLIAAAYPLLPDATRYAMGVLKHSLHSCYFCYAQKNAPLDEEVAFFRARLRQSGVLADLLSQRQRYHRSMAFVMRCVPMIFRLHMLAAWDNRFPRAVARASKGS